MAKAFSWSFSKLKNVETCPRRHSEIDLLKNWHESSEQLVWGNQVHAALAESMINSNVPLPVEMQSYQKYLDVYRGGNGLIEVERKYAITKDFQPTPWFAPNAWYRGVCDLLKINGPVAIAVDWKTGKIKPDSVQLMLMAQCIFSHFPAVQLVETHFVWLNEDATTRERYTRADVAGGWVGLLPRVNTYENMLKSGDFPPKPGGLCRSYCPVQSCEHHGKYRK